MLVVVVVQSYLVLVLSLLLLWLVAHLPKFDKQADYHSAHPTKKEEAKKGNHPQNVQQNSTSSSSSNSSNSSSAIQKCHLCNIGSGRMSGMVHSPSSEHSGGEMEPVEHAGEAILVQGNDSGIGLDESLRWFGGGNLASSLLC